MLFQNVALLFILNGFPRVRSENLTVEPVKSGYDECMAPNSPSSVGVMLNYDVWTMWNIYTWQNPIAKCACETDDSNWTGFTKYFWTPVKDSETKTMNSISNNSK